MHTIQKIINQVSKKNILHGNNNITKIFLLLFVFTILNSTTVSICEEIEKYVEITILDKINSKSSNLVVKIGQQTKFKNLLIKPLKCKNSEFDDNPEITAYLQVKDVTLENKDKVFVFNDWTFASSPSLKPFDHPIYDIWLSKCIIK